MFEFLNPLREMTTLSVCVRMLIAMALGAVIGLERSAKNRPAGFRTHILVCLGAATAAMTGLFIVLKLGMLSDASRISAQVISGLGFIVAGTIVVTKKMSIKGLTTAAGLWTTGIIGLAVGSGYYELALIAAILVLLAETVFFDVGRKIKHQPEYTLEVHYNSKTSLDNVLRYCKDNGMSIINLKIHSSDDVSAEARYTAVISLRGTAEAEVLSNHVIQMPGIVSAAVL